MTDLSREAVDAALLRQRAKELLSEAMNTAGKILQGAGADEAEVWRATQAFVPLMKFLRVGGTNTSGSGEVAGAANPPQSGEASPDPVFSDPLAEEEASKASAPKGPSDAVVIQLDQLRQRAAKLARHDNERKPQP